MKKLIVICGPTASGKSALALALAEKINQAVIINADSMQLYKDIKIIAASPSHADQAKIPHKFYGTLEATDYCSVAEYVKMASRLIQQLLLEGKNPIIVGGTGMYINALMFGYSPIPDIDPEIRQSTRVKLSEIGNHRFFEELAALDPLIVQKLTVGDSQRILRAYEVILQSGKSIAEFHAAPPIQSLPDCQFEVIMLNPERNFLYNTCNERFYQLIKNGAIEEVEKLLKSALPHNLQPFKALGVSEIIEYLSGRLTLEQAINFAQTKTRQYAKRQVTWFTHQIPHKQVLNYSNFAEYNDMLLKLTIEDYFK